MKPNNFYCCYIFCFVCVLLSSFATLTKSSTKAAPSAAISSADKENSLAFIENDAEFHPLTSDVTVTKTAIPLPNLDQTNEALKMEMDYLLNTIQWLLQKLQDSSASTKNGNNSSSHHYEIRMFFSFT